MRIVFFGTPEFAVPGLRRLAGSTHDITGVVTAPDRPGGRGLKVAPSPVKSAAIEMNIPVLQPEKLQDDSFLSMLRSREADCYVVVGFRILPAAVFTMPPRGTVNLHASLLPRYRGAAPIQWAIINGDRETGVTTFFIREKVDTGDLILQKSVTIGPEETAGQLHDRLADAGAKLLLDTMNRIEAGMAKGIPQTGVATVAPKLNPEDGHIDWSHPASRIACLIRGLSPAPGAYAFLKGKRVKLFRASVAVSRADANRQPGEILSAGGDLEIMTGDGSLRIRELQMEGRRRMTAEAFLRGFRIEEGEMLQ